MIETGGFGGDGEPGSGPTLGIKGIKATEPGEITGVDITIRPPVGQSVGDSVNRKVIGVLHQFADSFSSGACQVLVSTTVVEVGVDVPEASVMMIDHAERFGLAQLHQLRVRVGRGAAASHCLLINGSSNPLARQRLDVLVRSTDGFEIAEMDLRLRGPGQVLGTRQSGLPDLALASLADDAAVLEDARSAAQVLLRDDPNLDRCPQLRALLDDQQRRLIGGTPLN